MSSLNDVTILVSNIKTGDTYQARSYPCDDNNLNWKPELYRVPVYKVFINGDGQVKEWKALRFMPYFNDPQFPAPGYRTMGWVNSGLRSTPKIKVTYYNPKYKVHNTTLPYDGAIQISGNFLIHAGPLRLSSPGIGGAGCVEIVGDFNNFKNDIKVLSGSTKSSNDAAILELVAARKLYVKVNYAAPPDIKANFVREEFPRNLKYGL